MAPKVGLDREQVLRAAAEIVDSSGIDGLTLSAWPTV